MSQRDGFTRRDVVGGAGLLLGACTAPQAMIGAAQRAPDVRLAIAPHKVELAPGIVYDTFAYNDQVPGPVIRLPKGRNAIVEVTNLLQAPEIVHWHGLEIPSDVDGAEEEGTPPVPPLATRRYEFAPTPGGTHWYHTHMIAAKTLMFGAYSGLFGFVVVEGDDPGAYDQEVCVAMHHWGSRWVPGQTLRPDDPEHGLEVAFDHGTMNGRLLGHDAPVRVRQGQRVLFRLLNASATEINWISLSGHKLRVVAMDGYPVPTPCDIEVLMMGPGERADVIVEMNNPGKWILGSANDAERGAGMGMIVEYADATGEPRWTPVKRTWAFDRFADARAVPEPDARIELTIGRIPGGPNGYNVWTLNGKAWPETGRIRVETGKRYRLVYNNRTDQGHPMHLHRHHFEVVRWDKERCPGLMKDTINIKPFTTAELDFVARNPGPTLIHCHQAKHQDFGLMALMLYEGDVEPEFDHTAMHRAITEAYCREG